MNGRKKTNFRYGLWGWALMLYSALGFMTNGAFWTNNAQNVMVPQLAERIGVEAPRLLALCSVSGWLAVFGLLAMGMLFGKFKTKIMQTVSCIVCGIVLILYGRVTSVFGYIACYFMLDIFCTSASVVGVPQIVTSYFPTKKGSFLGWATCGASLSGLICLPILAGVAAKQGVGAATMIFGLFSIVMGLVNWFFIPNTPEEAGRLPDNGDFNKEEFEAHKKMMQGPSVWTLKEAMRNKNFWIIPIAYGILFMCNIGVMSQMVPYQISQGVAQPNAVKLMQMSFLFSIPGSIFSGWLDQKIGTRKTGMTMAACYVICLFCGSCLPYNSVTNWIFVGLLFFWAGAISNLPMSHACSVFGPRDYPVLWGRMQPMMALIRVSNAIVLSFFLTQFGTHRSAYMFFMFLAAVAFVLMLISDSQIVKEPGQKPTAAYK